MWFSGHTVRLAFLREGVVGCGVSGFFGFFVRSVRLPTRSLVRIIYIHLILQRHFQQGFYSKHFFFFFWMDLVVSAFAFECE